jgi:hypothetical protein
MCDGVYRERAHLLAHLATIYPAHFETDPAEPDWPVLHLNLPTGQCCWHISPDDLHLFGHVETEPGNTWDGHTTEEKYRRIDQLTRLRVPPIWC